jgi:uncharacterized phiE125 gp8 family phage protein
MSYKVTTQVTSEPVTLEEARAHLRIEPFGSPLVHPDDDYITALITTARAWLEEYLKRALATQTVTLVADKFPDGSEYYKAIKLPLAPVQYVDSVSYVDSNGATQTLATSVYEFDEYAFEIVLKYGQVWPVTRAQNNAVTVVYTAGYADGLSPDLYPVPAPIKQAMLLMIGNYYENRQQDVMTGTKLTANELPMGVFSLVQPYRISLGV